MILIIAMMMKMTSIAECLISVGGMHKNKNRRRCVRNYPFTQGIKVSGPDDDDDDDDVHKNTHEYCLLN